MNPEWLLWLTLIGSTLSLPGPKLIQDALQVCDGVFLLPEMIDEEVVQPYVLNPMGEVSGHYWLMSPMRDDPKPYFAITEMTLNDNPFLVFARMTDTIIEQAKMNLGEVCLDSPTMFNFVLALSKRCIRTGEAPSLAMDKNFIVADADYLQAASRNGAIFSPLKTRAMLVPKFFDQSFSQRDSFLVLYEFRENGNF
ncbi:hypothetical protein BIW11_08565 [Tropilaelaps mercedesae]|uniref:Uncharacterized protein n=1 Tax=Tropilaelaps mercedesae TaxID=418985 RepID=A0A1V9XNY1_9ACAR|nr:hypothetical protein BIW11_08565 [Tropilaelaps mercedesae]